MIDEDGEQYKVKMGRFSDADEALIKHIMGKKFLRHGGNSKTTKEISRPKPAQKKLTDFQVQERVSRSNVIANGYSCSDGRETVVKAGRCQKSINGVVSQISYIARIKPHDAKSDELCAAVELRDGYGNLVSHEEALNVAKNWDLMTDEENLSKKAINLINNGEDRKLGKLDERNLLNNIQSWHFVLSIEESSDDGSVENQFRAAVIGVLDNVFVAKGHKLLWGIHPDHTDHIHAHTIIKAQSELGGRIHSDYHGDFLHGIRVEFARNLRLAGLNYQATRRVDRGNTIERIMAGHEPLKNDHNIWKKNGSKSSDFASLLIMHPWLRERKSVWDLRLRDIRQSVYDAVDGLPKALRFQVASAIIKEHLDKPPANGGLLKRAINKRRNQQEEDKASKNYQSLLDEIKTAFHRPSEALAAWQNVATGGSFRDKKGNSQYPNRPFASWIMIKRPELFGDITSLAFDLMNSKRLRNLLREAWLPSPEAVAKHHGKHSGAAEGRGPALISKDRGIVLSELNRHADRVEFELGNETRAEVIRNYISTSANIDIGQKLLGTQIPNLDSGKSTARRPSVSSVSQVKSTTGVGARKESPANENKNEAEDRQKPRAPTKKRSGWER